MTPLRPRLPTLCPFLYPPRPTQSSSPLLLLCNLQPSQSRSYATKSVQAQRQANPEAARIRNDMGLLPGTFVMPSGPRKPSLLRTPKLRMRLEWYRIKNKWRALRASILYKYFIKSRPWPKLQRRKIAPEAKKLYEKMYTAFADGDVATLKSVCHEGLLTSLSKRINVRPRNESLRWTLHRYIGFSHIVDTNIVSLNINKSALYQVIVKLKSAQSLERKGANGLPSDPAEEKKMVEYVVLQRMMLRGKEGEWKIWGSIDESKVEAVLGEDAMIATPTVGK